MFFKSDGQRDQLLARLSLISLYILLAYNFVMIVIGYFLSQSHMLSDIGNPLVRKVFFAVVVAEMIAIYLVRTLMLKRVFRSHAHNDSIDEKVLYKDLLNITIIVAAMCSAISTYGLILVVLGEKIEILVLFAAISLIGYQFFRLRPKDFEEKLH
jgi:hypothetical protein